jgi:hypothetical protein
VRCCSATDRARVTVGRFAPCAAFRWAALLFPVVDCLNTVIFLVLILFLRARLQSVTRAVDGKLITAADYTVFVRGLPKDVTEEEVLNHFNSLYDLGNADWTFSGFAFGIGRKMHKRREELTKSRNAAMVRCCRVRGVQCACVVLTLGGDACPCASVGNRV